MVATKRALVVKCDRGVFSKLSRPTLPKVWCRAQKLGFKPGNWQEIDFRLKGRCQFLIAIGENIFLNPLHVLGFQKTGAIISNLVGRGMFGHLPRFFKKQAIATNSTT